MELWFSECHTNNVKLSIRTNKELYSAQSDYQRFDVMDTPEFGKVLISDGEIVFSEADEFIYDILLVHYSTELQSCHNQNVLYVRQQEQHREKYLRNPLQPQK